MDDNRKRNVLIIMFGIIILLLIFIIYLLISSNYLNNGKSEDYGRLEIVNTADETGKDYGIDETIDNELGENNNIDNDNKNVEVVEKNTNNANNYVVKDNDMSNNFDDDEANNSSVSYSENDVISYFQNNESKINSSSFKEKFKEYFIEIVDFIFYGTEIKGYTFNELTNTGKLKVISAALKIDSYIEEKSPGYKDTIKSTSSRVYTNAKEKLTTLFLDISSSVCKNKGEDCNKAKELFGDIKSTCKIGWSFIKNLLKSGSNKLKEWYEVYSGK